MRGHVAEGGGIRLSRPSRADAPALIAAHRASRTLHHPWVQPFTDEVGFEAWFLRGLTGPNIGLVVRRVDGNAPVGVVNLNEIAGGAFHSAYLGYWAMAGQEGRGAMRWALTLALEFAFRDLGLHRLEANIQPGNLRSIALVRGLGFRHEGFSPRYLRIGGEWRDHERWARLTDDPPAEAPLAEAPPPGQKPAA
ncbi:GNAT family N-acetyltransferase [Roseomonas sp. OT10]|uniref:GNAT family N-acetyltransferase n=1 Tax=Roseomonas cutis TaxID=2897332 RepID=UPI001E4EC355|nr:GNAT family protein [Roseomonas sp. OT10]UFN50406.1 GNAT family N-acetyltransferase [Roseomonas sp. OT10]